MQLREFLSGFEPGFPQSVGNMTVIPLLSTANQFEGIAGAENVALAKDNNYSSLHLKPVEDLLTIVPAGFTFITKEAAQDRTVPRTQVLTGQKEVQAYCVQSSQGGHMQGRNTEEREVRLLPLAIRQLAFDAAPKDRSCSALWDKLAAYNRSLGVQGNFLVTLFNQYTEQLDAFVAQFEPISNQRGAIVLINGRVAGIDVFPSFHSYLQIWERLIRDAYGMEAIANRSDWSLTKAFPMQEPRSVNEVLEVVNQLKQAERNWAYNIVTQCLDQDVTTSGAIPHYGKSGEMFTISELSSPELKGEVVYSVNQGQKAVYLSLFRHAIAAKKVQAFAL